MNRVPRHKLTRMGIGECYDCGERHALYRHPTLTVAGTCRQCIAAREVAAGQPGPRRRKRAAKKGRAA